MHIQWKPSAPAGLNSFGGPTHQHLLQGWHQQTGHSLEFITSNSYSQQTVNQVASTNGSCMTCWCGGCAPPLSSQSGSCHGHDQPAQPLSYKFSHSALVDRLSSAVFDQV